MQPQLLIIPAALIIIGIVFMVVMNKKRMSAKPEDTEAALRELVNLEVPAAKTGAMDVVDIREDAINASHIWVLAYNKDGMYMIPALPNPITKKVSKYEDLVPEYDLRKQIANNIMSGNKSEETNYVPFASVSKVDIDENKKKIRVELGDSKLKLKYSTADCFGAPQEAKINKLLSTLRSI